jgi:hypothetical protein
MEGILFFKKKKSENDLAPSGEVPRAPRYASFAMVTINGFEGRAVLRNVSSGGFCMESKTFADMDISSSYTIRIDPEESAGVGQFELTVEVRWISSSPDKFSVGFKIICGNDRSFEKHLEFLREQHQKRAG